MYISIYACMYVPHRLGGAVIVHEYDKEMTPKYHRTHDVHTVQTEPFWSTHHVTRWGGT